MNLENVTIYLHQGVGIKKTSFGHLRQNDLPS